MVMNWMDDFEREQREMLKLSDRIRYDKSINTIEKHRLYVDIVKTFLEKHISGNFQFIKYSLIDGLPGKFHLIMVKKDTKPVASEKTPCYELESIVAVVEIRGHGLVNYKDRLEDDVKVKRDRFEEIKAKKKRDVTCLYLTFQEREITKGTDYDRLSRKHLGPSFFSLRESTTQKVRDGEWNRFVKALIGP
jgi:hypothetical protein